MLESHHSCRQNDHGGVGIPHSHDLTSGEAYDAIPDSRLLWSVLLNQILTCGQIIAGVLSGSVALLSDAAHNFSDANSLLIAYIARRISRRAASDRYTFGYRRAELIGATINLTLLAAVGFVLIYEAGHRFFDPQPVIGWLMAAAAGLALAVDLGTAALLWAMSRGSLNVRTAFIHNLVDAAGSFAVLIGAAVIMTTGWQWIDPLLTLLIAGYILYQVRLLLPQAVRILMEGTPKDFDLPAMIEVLQRTQKVNSIHHVHVWELDERHRALEACVRIDLTDASALETIKASIKNTLEQRYQIQHSTLEFELTPSPSMTSQPPIQESNVADSSASQCWQNPQEST